MAASIAAAALVLAWAVDGHAPVTVPVAPRTFKGGSFTALGDRDTICRNAWVHLPQRGETSLLEGKLDNLGLNLDTLWMPVQTAKSRPGHAVRSAAALDDTVRRSGWQGRMLLGSVLQRARGEHRISDHIWHSTALEKLTKRLLSPPPSPGSFSSNASVVSVMDAEALTPDILLRFAEQSKPVIIRNGLLHAGWNATRWNDEELLARYGNTEIHVAQVGADGSVPSTSKMNVATFMQSPGEGVYTRRLPIGCALPEELLSLPVPVPIVSGVFSLLSEGPVVYWGKGFTPYHLHVDAFDNYYTVLEGVKFMRLFDREDVRLDHIPWTDLGPAAVADPIFGNRSQEIQARPVDVVVSAGDVLFLPKGWGHFTLSASEGSHKAIAIWMNHTDAIGYKRRKQWPPVCRNAGVGSESEQCAAV